MDHIILHIGIHKTGTTSIQRYLSLIHDDLLKDGVLYPVAGRPRPFSGHHLLAWAIHGIHGVVDDQCWYEVMDEIQFHNPWLSIISAEGFETCTQDQIHKIQHYLKGESVKIVVYLRNQLDFMISDYKEAIKTAGYYHPFGTYLKGNAYRCNYDLLVNKWGNAFDIENIDIRLFDKVKQHPGLLKDFLLVANVNIDQEDRNVRANISPSDDLIILIRFINKLTYLIGPRSQRIINRSIVGSSFLGRGMRFFSRRFVNAEICSEHDRAWLRNKVEDWNQSFLNSFIEPADHIYFEF